VARRKQERLDEVKSYLAERGSQTIGDAGFAELSSRLRPITDHDLRKLLRSSGYTLSAFVEGVRQDDLETLERTLVALAAEYEASEGDRARAIRREVITAKDHARFASRRAKTAERRAEKEEMLLWMMVWLENPAVFATWVKLRRRAVEPGAPN
jgi:hypothetical protein